VGFLLSEAVFLGRRWFRWRGAVLDGVDPLGVAAMAWALGCGVERWPMTSSSWPRSGFGRARPGSGSSCGRQ
jgi:hypothetical protein